MDVTYRIADVACWIHIIYIYIYIYMLLTLYVQPCACMVSIRPKLIQSSWFKTTHMDIAVDRKGSQFIVITM